MGVTVQIRISHFLAHVLVVAVLSIAGVSAEAETNLQPGSTPDEAVAAFAQFYDGASEGSEDGVSVAAMVAFPVKSTS